MTLDNATTSQILEASQSRVIQHDPDAQASAWLTTFFIENHLDYFTFPDHAATPEQIRFMVYCDEDCRYYPCSDQTFDAIMARRPSDYLKKEYALVLETIIGLIDRQIDDKMEKEYLTSLIRIKYNHETRDDIMIPSRVQKRLLGIFLKRTQIEDPFRQFRLPDPVHRQQWVILGCSVLLPGRHGELCVDINRLIVGENLERFYPERLLCARPEPLVGNFAHSPFVHRFKQRPKRGLVGRIIDPAGFESRKVPVLYLLPRRQQDPALVNCPSGVSKHVLAQEGFSKCLAHDKYTEFLAGDRRQGPV